MCLAKTCTDCVPVPSAPIPFARPTPQPWVLSRYPSRYSESSSSSDMGEILMDAEEITPRSPQQSDSEGSTSSLELGTGVANIALSSPGSGTPPRPSVQEAVKCRWQHCGLWFKHLDQLAAHVSMVHAAAGPGGLFYCGWEGCMRGHRGFNARYKMLVHVRTHTNEKPHRCSMCDKSFSRAENLKIHARSHTGERPYTCPVPGCNKAYSNSSDRFKHTRTHAVDKPYVCKVEGCPKRYTDPSSLRKHVKTYRHFPGASLGVGATTPSPSPQNSPQGSRGSPSLSIACSGSDEEESQNRSGSAFRPVMYTSPESLSLSLSFSHVPVHAHAPVHVPASTERAQLPGEYRQRPHRGIPIKKSISARVRLHEQDSGSVSDYDHTTDGSVSPPAPAPGALPLPLALNQRACAWAGGSVWVSSSSPSASPSGEDASLRASPETLSLSPSSSPSAEWYPSHLYPAASAPAPAPAPMDVYRSWLDGHGQGSLPLSTPTPALPWGLPLWTYPALSVSPTQSAPSPRPSPTSTASSALSVSCATSAAAAATAASQPQHRLSDEQAVPLDLTVVRH